jgi:hypothetical protein
MAGLTTLPVGAGSHGTQMPVSWFIGQRSPYSQRLRLPAPWTNRKPSITNYVANHVTNPNQCRIAINMQQGGTKWTRGLPQSLLEPTVGEATGLVIRATEDRLQFHARLGVLLSRPRVTSFIEAQPSVVIRWPWPSRVIQTVRRRGIKQTRCWDSKLVRWQHLT